jgi:RHS repeat-associated protein
LRAIGGPGQYYDSETGLFNNVFRDYDSSTGRYIQSDRKGLQGGQLSTYAYVNNVPLRLTDPEGLCPSQKCLDALKTAGQTKQALDNVAADWNTILSASADYGIDPALLAAIGVRESGFTNVAQSGGGLGAGVFQIDAGANSFVTSAQAYNVTYATNFAAAMLSGNMASLAASYPNLDQTQLLQATAASYNFGAGNISGNPNTIDVGTTGNNYGQNVLDLMSCFDY